MAAITYNFGNLLSDFHKADSPAKRLEAVDGYGARRMQGLTRFIRDLNEGTLDDPEDFVMGFTLLEVLVTESNALSQAAIYSRYTDNAQDQKRFQDRVIGWQKTLWTQQKIAMDLIDQIPAETQENYRSDIRHFDARMKQLHKDHRKMPDYKKLADMAVTGVERGLWDLSVKHGQDALDAAYCGTEEAGADPAIGQKMAQLFTHRLRGIEGTLRRKGVQDYAEYFEKRSGIPAGITRALTEKPIATLQDRFPQEPNKVYSRRHGHKAIQSSIEAYAAFSPSFGQTLQRFYEDGGIIFNTARDNPSERGYAICAEDTFPYTRHTGNMTGVHIDAKYIGDDMELQRLMDHELSHALHVESLKAERALKHEFSFTKDSFLIELVAHVGEIIGLEHRISTMRNADHAMDLLTDYSTCKDLNIVSDAMSILAQQELIAAYDLAAAW